ncbi:hypothetical protein SCA6_019262 [Theobroma cacao]
MLHQNPAVQLFQSRQVYGRHNQPVQHCLVKGICLSVDCDEDIFEIEKIENRQKCSSFFSADLSDKMLQPQPYNNSPYLNLKKCD